MKLSRQCCELAFICSLAVGACSDQPQPNTEEFRTASIGSCVQRPRAWPVPPPGYIGSGIGGLDFSQVEVRADGSIRWNNEEVDLKRTGFYLHTNAQLEPPFPVVLRTTVQSQCETAEQIRAMMDQLDICREGFCFESATWVSLGLPVYENYYDSDGKRR